MFGGVDNLIMGNDLRNNIEILKVLFTFHVKYCHVRKYYISEVSCMLNEKKNVIIVKLVNLF
jgi:hypothetical protein